jgi:MFS transporter, DHA2 family, multidrug resistance protein
VPKASRREWVELAVIALPCLLYSMDLWFFQAPAFSASLTAFLLSIFVIAGIFFFIAQYLRLVLGPRRLRRACGCYRRPAGL